jgi:hypothetical protein
LMSRADGKELARIVDFALSAPRSANSISDYQITDFSHRVAGLILSTAKLAPTWLNRQS